MRRGFYVLIALLSFAATSRASELVANATSNNGGSPGWAMFFDVSANSTPLTITGLTTASTAAAGATFNIEVLTRTGTALGGSATTGPGSSPDGWTSLGVATATQGATAGGISLPVDIPDVSVGSGVTGVALLFTGAGPRYFGTGTPPYQTFSDSALTLVTGDARSTPFVAGGSFFASRGLTGSLIYTNVPEPGTVGLAIVAAAGTLVRRRR